MKVAIVGASGFTGLELIKIIHMHPKFELSYVATTTGDTTIDGLHPALKDVVFGCVEKIDLDFIAKNIDMVFLAVPHKAAMELVSVLMPSGIKIVDLSADYRLELATYESNYCPHTDAKNLENSVYGLPELFEKDIASAQLVANPGCYPTSVILGLLPFVNVLKEDAPIFIDAKSGVSGAGKKCVDTTHFVNINENMFAYAPLDHRHGAEVTEKLNTLTNRKNSVHFVPHLVPVTRGMLSSIYIQLSEDIDAVTALEDYYKEHYFVRVCSEPVSMKQVAGTNFCDIYVKQEGQTLFISSAIDNLLRGASSQAVVNANLMSGFNADMGIPLIAYNP